MLLEAFFEPSRVMVVKGSGGSRFKRQKGKKGGKQPRCSDARRRDAIETTAYWAHSMRRGDEAKSAAAPAVTTVLDGQQREEVDREKRGRARGRQSASGMGEDVIARLTVAAQVSGQQSALLSRLVSRDPTKKARPSVEGPVRIREEEEARDLATSASVDGSFGATEDRAVRRRQRHDGRLDLPISVDEFDKSEFVILGR
jgi:hypothetical protein